MIRRGLYFIIRNRKFTKAKTIPANLYAKRNLSSLVYLIDEENNGNKTNYKAENKSCLYTSRTFTCGDLKLHNVGNKVTLCGWLEFQRLDKFLILRDGYGQTQILIKDNDTKLKDLVKKISLESILKVQGTVLARPKNMINENIPTGEIEVVIDNLEILNEASELPFNIRGFQKPNEALRMQFRYLDLRFPEMQKNLRVRSSILFKMRKFLMDLNFVDVETPTLFKATPGGAQEFIVPTQFPGEFYSLVQSPQQFKQTLMAGSIDRYFQIARCYRDETSRPDRQPEFTQLDIEMSFTSMNSIMELIEDLLNECWPEFAGTIPKKFPRIKFSDALEFYGSDKPDISFDYKLGNVTHLLENSNLNSVGEKFGAYCLKFPKEHLVFPKSLKNQFENLNKHFPLAKLIQSKISTKEEWVTKVKNLFTEDKAQDLIEALTITDDSLLFLAYGERSQVLGLLGRIRTKYVDFLEDSGISIKKKGMHLAWIVDFPLFEEGDQPGSLASAHHPFTAPHPDDMHILINDPLKVRALAYDLVLNGNEIAGGSIRIHDPSLQENIFKLLKIDPQSMKHILEMLSSGCPPHGGIAIGLDRFLSILLSTQSIRDVIAFPKGAEGRDPLSGAPSPVPEKDLDLYHIKCSKK